MFFQFLWTTVILFGYFVENVRISEERPFFPKVLEFLQHYPIRPSQSRECDIIRHELEIEMMLKGGGFVGVEFERDARRRKTKGRRRKKRKFETESETEKFKDFDFLDKLEIDILCSKALGRLDLMTRMLQTIMKGSTTTLLLSGNGPTFFIEDRRQLEYIMDSMLNEPFSLLGVEIKFTYKYKLLTNFLIWKSFNPNPSNNSNSIFSLHSSCARKKRRSSDIYNFPFPEEPFKLVPFEKYKVEREIIGDSNSPFPCCDPKNLDWLVNRLPPEYEAVYRKCLNYDEYKCPKYCSFPAYKTSRRQPLFTVFGYPIFIWFQ